MTRLPSPVCGCCRTRWHPGGGCRPGVRWLGRVHVRLWEIRPALGEPARQWVGLLEGRFPRPAVVSGAHGEGVDATSSRVGTWCPARATWPSRPWSGRSSQSGLDQDWATSTPSAGAGWTDQPALDATARVRAARVLHTHQWPWPRAPCNAIGQRRDLRSRRGHPGTVPDPVPGRACDRGLGHPGGAASGGVARRDRGDGGDPRGLSGWAAESQPAAVSLRCCSLLAVAS